MQIKTVIETYAPIFDRTVNDLITEGWALTHRELVKTSTGAKDYFYAEMEMRDGPAEHFDPMAAVDHLREFCEAHALEDCEAQTCALSEWCDRVVMFGKSPADWPGVQTR